MAGGELQVGVGENFEFPKAVRPSPDLPRHCCLKRELSTHDLYLEGRVLFCHRHHIHATAWVPTTCWADGVRGSLSAEETYILVVIGHLKQEHSSEVTFHSDLGL